MTTFVFHLVLTEMGLGEYDYLQKKTPQKKQ